MIKADGTFNFFLRHTKKIVLDTTKLSIEQIASMTKKAFTSRSAYVTEEKQKYIKGVANNGEKFYGWINSEAKQLESFYPVKEWQYNC